MTDTKRKSLIERMKTHNEHFSFSFPKRDWTDDQIVERVAGFLLAQYKLRICFAYGNEVGESLEDKDDQRFDPIALYASAPEKFEDIVKYGDYPEFCALTW